MTTLSQQSQKIRTGKFTGSELHKLMGAKGFGKTGETYIMEKVAEALTGEKAMPEFDSAATRWGTEKEPEAKEYFTAATGIILQESDTLENDFIAGTPDAVAAEYGIEIKCPYNAGNHLKNLLLPDAAAVKDQWPEYYWQMYAYMWLTGLQNWKFVSYHPSFPDEKRMIIISVPLVAADMAILQGRVTEAKLIFDNTLAKLTT